MSLPTYAIPSAPANVRIPGGTPADWTDFADEFMPLVDAVIRAVQQCHFLGSQEFWQRRQRPEHYHQPDECNEWSCPLIDPAVEALFAWAEQHALGEPAE